MGGYALLSEPSSHLNKVLDIYLKTGFIQLEFKAILRTKMTESEWQTRKKRIDTKLKSLGWQILPYKESLNVATLGACAVEEFSTENGPADYALFVKGKLLGIIEAKKVSVNPQNVLEQAKRYARGVRDGAGSWNDYGVPFLYSTNGELIHFIDVRRENSFSRTIANFHTPDALSEFFARTDGSNWLAERSPADLELRPYQEQAIIKTEEAIAKGKRSLLLAMATGTGKTRTTVSQIYRLLKSGTAKRILFLVDRRALATQAIRELHSFNTPEGNKFTQEYDVFSQRFRRGDLEEDVPFDPSVLPEEYLTKPHAKHTFVYVSTIQRMAINLLGGEGAFGQAGGDVELEEDVNQLDIPIHAFDVIIADECHRGYTPKDTGIWMKVLNYFDAIKIGLTATPAAHTLTLFNEVAFRYTTEEAIRDGWLVDYDVVKIKSDVRVKGAFLKEGDSVGVVDTETGQEIYDQLEDEREYDASKIEKDITSPDSNRKIIQEVAKYAYAHEKETGHFPKILIFADNDLPHTSHSDQLVKICREVFGQGDSFVQKITGSPSVDRPLQRIREFRNRPEPKVVVSVDMLTTGVDIPALEFIVFLRMVKSRILWVQMLGRGTRRCPEINKTHFTIFDCFDGTLIQYFKDATDFNLDTPEIEVVPIKQVIENIYQNIDRQYYTRILVKRLHRIDRNMSAEARQLFAAYIPDGDVKKFASELTGKLEQEFANTMKLLRDERFQDLLVNYPRAKRSFLVGYNVQDDVTSELVIKRGQDYLKPEDYLEAFARFVQDKADEIAAFHVLLKKPKEWRAKTLEGLKQTLIQNDYKVEDLQKAHKVVSHKSLADIISIVKHAAKEEEPIFTIEERVDRALIAVTADKTFTKDQQEWFGLIREHLIQNLTIEVDDFQTAPIFERRGGLVKAQKIFAGKLKELVEEINYRLAA